MRALVEECENGNLAVEDEAEAIYWPRWNAQMMRASSRPGVRIPCIARASARRCCR
jgi:DNA-binding IclR family transcriptional regulator